MRRFIAGLLACTFAFAPAVAQWPAMKPVAAPAEPGAIPLRTGGMPGMPPESWFTLGTMRTVRNVSQATLTPFLPDPAKATGAAVVIAPGGGFMMLSMDNEGWPEARWFAAHGIAAFVLKYRLRPTPADFAQFPPALGKMMAEAARTSAVNVSAPPEAVADAQAAMRMVRARAAEWRVDPKRVGFIGSSAGAITAMALTLADKPESRPDFVGYIYGPMGAVAAPADAPPLFAALAVDDPLFGKSDFGLIGAWRQARRPIEMHLYQSGGHGFGMGAPGTTTSQWLQSFYDWLAMNRFLKPRN